VVSTIKKYTLESFSEYAAISNVVKVGRKSVPGGWTGVEETTFCKFSSCSWKNINDILFYVNQDTVLLTLFSVCRHVYVCVSVL